MRILSVIIINISLAASVTFAKSIDTPELNALKVIFGADADTALKVYDKSNLPTRENSYSITSFYGDDTQKKYPSISTVGNDSYFSICPAYLDIVKDIVLAGKSTELIFSKSLEKHKIVRQFFHNASSAVTYGGTDSDQSKFVDRTIVAQKTVKLDIATLQAKTGAWLSVFEKCKDRRPTIYPPSEEKKYSDAINEVEEKLKSMMVGKEQAPSRSR